MVELTSGGAHLGALGCREAGNLTRGGPPRERRVTAFAIDTLKRTSMATYRV
jgi:hypothetical protein